MLRRVAPETKRYNKPSTRMTRHSDHGFTTNHNCINVVVPPKTSKLELDQSENRRLMYENTTHPSLSLSLISPLFPPLSPSPPPSPCLTLSLPSPMTKAKGQPGTIAVQRPSSELPLLYQTHRPPPPLPPPPPPPPPSRRPTRPVMPTRRCSVLYS